MEMGTAAVFDRKEPQIVQIRSNETVFGQTHAVTVIGLRHVTGRGIREMNLAAIAHEVKQGTAIAPRIG